MSESGKHTPGPWLVDPERPYVVTDDAHNPMDVAYSECDGQVGLANARLIAAAPDLLAACEAADKWFDGWCASATCCAHTGKEVHLQIRAAIAKAEGEG